MTQQEPVPTVYNAPEQSPGFLLWRASSRWRTAQREALAPLGLTRSRFVVLSLLIWLEAEGPITQSRIAHVSALDRMTTSQVVRALERDGFVERRANPDDARAWALRSTASGRRLARKAIPLVEQADEKFFSAVDDREALIASLLPLADGPGV